MYIHEYLKKINVNAPKIAKSLVSIPSKAEQNLEEKTIIPVKTDMLDGNKSCFDPSRDQQAGFLLPRQPSTPPTLQNWSEGPDVTLRSSGAGDRIQVLIRESLSSSPSLEEGICYLDAHLTRTTLPTHTPAPAMPPALLAASRPLFLSRPFM